MSGTIGLLFTAVGSIIGSGWLFAAEAFTDDLAALLAIHRVPTPRCR